MKNIRYFLESCALYVIFIIFRIMPLDMASATGGMLARIIGSRLPATKNAYKNLERAFPDKSHQEHKKIVIDMWDNLGRIFGEYPHLAKISQERVHIENIETAETVSDNHLSGIFISGHIGNWEIVPVSLSPVTGPVNVIYRAPNNPWADKLLFRIRNKTRGQNPIPKSRAGTRNIVKAIQENQHIGILFDQKYNEGLPIPFFGSDAMTSDLFVQLAQKYKRPIIPVRNERINNRAEFRLTVLEPIELFDKDNNPRPAKDILIEATTLLENWIRERPEQWLWIHRRWPKSNYQGSSSGASS